jgi:hypothetical protein
MGTDSTVLTIGAQTIRRLGFGEALLRYGNPLGKTAAHRAIRLSGSSG